MATGGRLLAREKPRSVSQAAASLSAGREVLERFSRGFRARETGLRSLLGQGRHPLRPRVLGEIHVPHSQPQPAAWSRGDARGSPEDVWKSSDSPSLASPRR